MSGHAILDSCHNCGTNNVPLEIVSQSPNSLSCGTNDETDDKVPYHHIHVFAACEKCTKHIWRKT